MKIRVVESNVGPGNVWAACRVMLLSPEDTIWFRTSAVPPGAQKPGTNSRQNPPIVGCLTERTLARNLITPFAGVSSTAHVTSKGMLVTSFVASNFASNVKEANGLASLSAISMREGLTDVCPGFDVSHTTETVLDAVPEKHADTVLALITMLFGR